MSLDLRLYVVTSGLGESTVAAAAAAARAGAGVVQVRAKDVEDRAALELLSRVAGAVAAVAPATRVLMDDRADVAWVARRRGIPVHGVHLGQGDLPAGEVRALLGSDAVIGITAGTLEMVRAAADLRGCADYLGAGPCRRTPTKDVGRPEVGIEGYRELVAASPLPVVAIGGVQRADVAALRATGVAGCAVVRAVMDADDPGMVAAGLLAEWERARPPGP